MCWPTLLLGKKSPMSVGERHHEEPRGRAEAEHVTVRDLHGRPVLVRGALRFRRLDRDPLARLAAHEVGAVRGSEAARQPCPALAPYAQVPARDRGVDVGDVARAVCERADDRALGSGGDDVQRGLRGAVYDAKKPDAPGPLRFSAGAPGIGGARRLGAQRGRELALDEPLGAERRGGGVPEAPAGYEEVQEENPAVGLAARRAASMRLTVFV